MLEHVGEAEATEGNLLLNGISGLGHVGVRERGVRLDGGVDGGFRNLEALGSPLGDVKVLPLGVGLWVLRKDAFSLRSEGGPVSSIEGHARGSGVQVDDGVPD